MSHTAIRLALVCLVVPLLSTASLGEEVWTARVGESTIRFDTAALQRSGLHIDLGKEQKTADPVELSLEITAESALTFSVTDRTFDQFIGGRLLHSGALVLRSDLGTCTLQPPLLSQRLGAAFEASWMLDGLTGAGGLMLIRQKVGFDYASQTLTIFSPDLSISPQMAESLGKPQLAGAVIGAITVRAHADWVGGDAPTTAPQLTENHDRALIGPDMMFCQLYQLAQYGRLGDIVGLAVGTTSWNVGDRDLMWYATPGTQHPFIVMNLYRLKADRFEQIGQSAIKHGFYALGNTQCGGSCTFEAGHGPGDWLGVGCTDTYSSSLNAAQSGLAPRSELNPWTGVWSYVGSHLASGGHSHNAIQHRLQVHDADLNPAQNTGATYYCEGYYAIIDDVNVMNSASWKPVTVSGSPGGTWSFGMTGSSTRPTTGFAIDAWTGATQAMLAQQVPPVEFVSPDGRCVLASKATDLGGGIWHYEYALLNIDMQRKVRSFSIPAPSWVTVSNIDFHAVQSHDEPYSNAAWASSRANGVLTWTTLDNPLRWGALYNFRFDAQAAPVSDSTVTLGHYEPGTPTSVAGLTVGPNAVLSGNALRGGLLWDKWWKVNGAAVPTGNHPLYPPIGQQSGATTYRCTECHGWDYKGAAGAFGSGVHFTGIRGVYGTTKTADEMFNLIQGSTGANAHGFAGYGLSTQDAVDLISFVQQRVIDTDSYIDGAAQFLGDPILGQENYETGGWISCIDCHGNDGTNFNFGTPQAPEWVGTVAVYNPWEMLHKSRFGQPGFPMPSWIDWGGTDQGAADLGRYCQLSMPVDCMTNVHCSAGDPCNHIKMCVGGRCVASTLDGDVNEDGAANGVDISLFVESVTTASWDPKICGHADFSSSGVMDTEDIPCMVSTLLGL